MVCENIKMIAEQYGSEFDLVFSNGGDQNNDTIPEKSKCRKMSLALIENTIN